jgi:hypothetical protein
MDDTPEIQGGFEFLLLVAESGFDIGLRRDLLTSNPGRTAPDSYAAPNLLVLLIFNRN